MPNGRSGGFVIKRTDLEQLLISSPDITVIGKSFTPKPITVTAGAARRALKNDGSESLGIEEQDREYYIIHIGRTETWIVVMPDTPLFTQLRDHHKRWLEKQHGP